MKKTVLMLAASLAINVTALAAFAWSVDQAQLPPAGEVTVTQLIDAAQETLLVRSQAGGQIVATGNGAL